MAIFHRPKSFALYHYRLGATQKHLRKFDDAVKALLDAINLDPEMYAAHKHLSEICRKLSELDLAEHHWLQYEKLAPSVPTGQVDG
ncbi:MULTISPECIES: tetratricopeptide repeat protein [unclassified Rhizobium]|uniref:tetratricopeptide repeat protein n=1 Tax=Rhizobium sp. Leaf453 TaxID=1736380 RepID=UPI0007884BA2